jgi:coenzyme F420-reducing hydrogenase gamma subunit
MSDRSPDKPKVAFYWCASCGGCEEAVVDLAEAILDVVAKVDIVFWPVAMDFKRKDVESMADGSITATFLNGAIRTSEQESMAQLLRSKSQLLVAPCQSVRSRKPYAGSLCSATEHDQCRRNTSTNALSG